MELVCRLRTFIFAPHPLSFLSSDETCVVSTGSQWRGGRGGDGGVAGMPGISDCPPLSPRPPAALPRQMRWGSLARGTRRGRFKKKEEGKKKKQTCTNSTNVPNVSRLGTFSQALGGGGRRLGLAWLGPGRKPSRMRHWLIRAALAVCGKKWFQNIWRNSTEGWGRVSGKVQGLWRKRRAPRPPWLGLQISFPVYINKYTSRRAYPNRSGRDVTAAHTRSERAGGWRRPPADRRSLAIKDLFFFFLSKGFGWLKAGLSCANQAANQHTEEHL